MSTATASTSLLTLPSTDPAQAPLPSRRVPREARVHRLSHGRSTLDELVSGAWAAVAAGAPAACPVCDGTLHRQAHAAECSRCGAELA